MSLSSGLCTPLTDSVLSQKTPVYSTEHIRCILEWQNVLLKHVTQQALLTPDQFLQLANYLGQLARWSRRLVETSIELCVFCRNNNEPYEVYTTHKVKDQFGRVTCPILRHFTCPVCGATGDQAHTIRYCPRLLESSSSSGTSLRRRSPGSGSLLAAFSSCSLQPSNSYPSSVAGIRRLQSKSTTGPAAKFIEAGVLDPSIILRF